jgi:uncharacterized protein YggE
VSVPSLEKYDELLLALTGADCRVTGLRFHFTDLEAVANRALVAAAEDLKRQELFMEETLGIELTVTDISIRRDIPSRRRARQQRRRLHAVPLQDLDSQFFRQGVRRQR